MHYDSKPREFLLDEVQASCELFAIFKVKRAVVSIKYTEEGKDCALFKDVLFVSCNFDNVAR